MSVAICDSTTLIYLAKLHALGLLTSLFDRVVIPRAVYCESVVDGKKAGHADATVIEMFVKRRGVTVAEAQSQ